MPIHIPQVLLPYLYQIYCNFLRKARLGGLGTERLKATTFGEYVRVCAPFRSLGSGSIYLVLKSIYLVLSFG